MINADALLHFRAGVVKYETGKRETAGIYLKNALKFNPYLRDPDVVANSAVGLSLGQPVLPERSPQRLPYSRIETLSLTPKASRS